MNNFFRMMTLVVLFLLSQEMKGQGYVSPFKMENGKVVMKTRSEIQTEEFQRSASSKYNPPKEFEKPKKKVNNSGEIWIDGFCRYRPPSYSTSNYNSDESESSYHREVFPTDTVMYTDKFDGNGNIPWAENAVGIDNKEACTSLLTRIPSYASDGLPIAIYDSLIKYSDYNAPKQAGSRKGREYEFSRAVSIWLKRTAGPDNMNIKYTTYFPFVNSEDYLDLEINDKGKFKIKAFCDNCDGQYKEIESGSVKTWHRGEWNEITVKKDEFNNISMWANEELICQYRIPHIPISAHFGGFRIEMPYQYEKKGLKYNVGGVTSIHYPKIK